MNWPATWCDCQCDPLCSLRARRSHLRSVCRSSNGTICSRSRSARCCSRARQAGRQGRRCVGAREMLVLNEPLGGSCQLVWRTSHRGEPSRGRRSAAVDLTRRSRGGTGAPPGAAAPQQGRFCWPPTPRSSAGGLRMLARWRASWSAAPRSLRHYPRQPLAADRSWLCAVGVGPPRQPVDERRSCAACFRAIGSLP